MKNLRNRMKCFAMRPIQLIPFNFSSLALASWMRSFSKTFTATRSPVKMCLLETKQDFKVK